MQRKQSRCEAHVGTRGQYAMPHIGEPRSLGVDDAPAHAGEARIESHDAKSRHAPSAESPLLTFRNGGTRRNRNPGQNVSVMFPQHQQEFEFRVASRKRNSEFISDYQRFATKARKASAG